MEYCYIPSILSDFFFLVFSGNKALYERHKVTPQSTRRNHFCLWHISKNECKQLKYVCVIVVVVKTKRPLTLLLSHQLLYADTD